MNIKRLLKNVPLEIWIALVFGIVGGGMVVYESNLLSLGGIILLIWGNNIALCHGINEELEAEILKLKRRFKTK